MCKGLRQAVEALSIDVDGPAIADVLQVMDLLDAKVTMALAAFDDRQQWQLDDRLSLKDWLRVHGHTTTLDAGRRARVAQRLRDLPTTAEAWLAGRLSSAQVRTITAPLTDKRRPTFAAHEPELIPHIEALDVADTDTVMREWRAAFDNAQPAPAPDEPERWLHHARTTDDRGEGQFSLDAASAAILDAALAIAETRDEPGAPRLPSERHADALVDIARHYLDNHERASRRRHAPHVSLVVTPEHLVSRAASPRMKSASQNRRSQGRRAKHSPSECETEDAASGGSGRRFRRMTCDSGHLERPGGAHAVRAHHPRPRHRHAVLRCHAAPRRGRRRRAHRPRPQHPERPGPPGSRRGGTRQVLPLPRL